MQEGWPPSTLYPSGLISLDVVDYLGASHIVLFFLSERAKCEFSDFLNKACQPRLLFPFLQDIHSFLTEQRWRVYAQFEVCCL